MRVFFLLVVYLGCVVCGLLLPADIDESFLRSQYPGTSMGIQQFRFLHKTLKSLGKEPNLLVFGVGNDSLLLSRMTTGTVLFLENSELLIEKVAQQHKELLRLIMRVEYTNTTVTECIKSDPLRMVEVGRLFVLPGRAETLRNKWDMIIVDGPEGFSGEKVGRVQSLFAASQVIKQAGGIIVVDDFERKCEAHAAATIFSMVQGKDRVKFKPFKVITRQAMVQVGGNSHQAYFQF